MVKIVWYWHGGTENGQWRPATFGGMLDAHKTADELAASLKRAGFTTRARE